MEVGPRLRESGPPGRALLGGLHPPIMPCFLSPRSPHGSGHQVRDALQSLPVYVVFLRLFLPFPVFKVSFSPVRVALNWPQPGSARDSLRVLWMPLGAWPLLGVRDELQPRQKVLGACGWGQELFGRPGLQALG